MPRDTTTKKANTPATRENVEKETRVQLVGETSTSAKPNSESHPGVEKQGFTQRREPASNVLGKL